MIDVCRRLTETVRLTALVAALLLWPVPPIPSAHAAQAPHNHSSLTVKPSTQLPPGVSPDWFSQATEHIRKAEYQFSAKDAQTFSAPNRAHNLRVTATTQGLAVTSRTEAKAWQLQLTLTHWGRPEAMISLAAVPPTATENRLEYRYDGLTAWYVNRETGLEQGFTITAPPTAPHKSSDDFSALVLELSYSDALAAVVSANGQTLTFTDQTGTQVLQYGGLHVTDALGKTLPATLVLTAAHTFQIQLDDRGAHYSLTIDPLMTTPGWSIVGDQAGAELGRSLATAGDVNGDGFSDVLLSAPYYDDGEANEDKVFL